MPILHVIGSGSMKYRLGSQMCHVRHRDVPFELYPASFAMNDTLQTF